MKEKDSSLFVELYNNPHDAEPVVRLFEAIAVQESWQHQGELRHHATRSVYLSLWQQADRNATPEMIGGLQIVTPDPVTGTLPCHNVWAELAAPVPTATTAHAAVLAVSRDWRGRNAGSEGRTALPAAFWTLCAALWRYCLQAGITELWLEATPTMLRCYRLLGLPLIVQGELRTHWGESCYPCKVSLRDCCRVTRGKGNPLPSVPRHLLDSPARAY